MNDEGSNDNPLDLLAEEFVARFRRGERPELAEFITRHPELADEIRDLFPALVMMEEIRPGEADTISGFDSSGPRSPTGQCLERLGDYRILREVGRGGMGIVYEAEQESLGRHVALKVLPAHAMLDPRHFQRFQREARAAAGLHHTNIVPVFGVGEQDGLHYFVMQFITGLGLDEVLVELKRLRKPKPRASRLPDQSQTSELSAAQIAAALLTGEFSRVAADENALGAGLPPPPKPPTAGLPPALPPPDSASGTVGRPGHSEERPGHSAGSDTSAARVESWRRTRFAPTDSSGVLLPGQRDNTSLSETGRTYWLSVARIGVQVADALAYANSQGVLHRDIKPSNLLLDTHGIVWVADFGLAKATDSDELTRTGDIVGTLRYLAPERLRGESDVRGDLYSLGVTLYEMLTLRSPFQDGDRARLVRQIADDEPTRPRAIDSAIPHDLETIVLKAIAKEPSDRYQTASALASDLRQFLEDKPIAARRFGPRERLWRWCRRNPVVAALTAAVAVLLVSAVVLLSISNARIRGETAQKEDALQTARENEELAERTAAEREQQRRIAVDRLYASQMNLAGQAFEGGQLARVLDLLESQRPQPGEPDLRGFEWHYLWREIHRALRVSFRQSGGEVWCLAFSPDGTSLAVGSKSGEQGALKLWDVATGALQASLEDDDLDVVSGLEFSPDGKFLASGSADERVRIWDVAARRVVARIGTNEVVRSIRWSRAGGLLAAGCQLGTVQVFDAASFDLKATIHTFEAPVLGLAFSADGKRLVTSVAWGGPKKHTLIHDLTSSPPQLLHDLTGYFVTDASPVDEMVASYESGVIHVWDPATLDDRTRITADAGWLNSVRFSSDARRIATAGFDDRVATVWDCETGQPVVRGPHAQAIQVVAFDPNRRFWASASIDGEVKIWHYDVPSESAPITHDPVIHRMFVSPRDRTLILGGAFVAEGRDIDTSQLRNVPAVGNLRTISADGRVLVAAVPASDENAPETIEIWDQSTGKSRQSWPLPDPARLYYENIALSNTGRLLATRSVNNPLRIWEVSGQEPRQIHDFAEVDAMCLAFSPDERLFAAGCQFGRVRLFNLETGEALPDLQEYESGSGWALSIAFSPDGERLAAGNSFGVVRVWDVRTRQLVATLKGHLGEVSDLAFFPDGRRLAVASVGSIRLWDVEVGQELLSLATPDERTKFLVVTSDGRTLISLHDSSAVRIWKSGLRDPSR